jgi:hypothetical protein
LAQLLAARRGVRNRLDLPPLIKHQILAWADAHFERTGQWPKGKLHPIPEAPDETWSSVDRALSQGIRTLPGDSSLAQLLAEERSVRNPSDLPPLTLEQILKWADIHFERTTDWPSATSGPIQDAPGETWAGVNAVLAKGHRGLEGGSTLAQLLAEHRGVRNRKKLPKLTEAQILAWADAHHERTGEWPNLMTGAITDQPGETWAAINHVLLRGSRGLTTSCSLADLLVQYREVRNIKNLPTFSEEQILAWADAHKKRTDKWPRVLSGPILECPMRRGAGSTMHSCTAFADYPEVHHWLNYSRTIVTCETLTTFANSPWSKSLSGRTRTTTKRGNGQSRIPVPSLTYPVKHGRSSTQRWQEGYAAYPVAPHWLSCSPNNAMCGII